MTPLRKLLKGDSACSPFNDAYDYDKMIALIMSKLTPEELDADPLWYTPFVTPFMNTFFKDFFKLLKEKMATANLPHKKMLHLLFACFNRNYLVILKKQALNFKGRQQINQNELFTVKITTLNEGMGPVDVNSTLEVEVDAFAYVLNYIRYFEDETVIIDNSLPPLHSIQTGQSIALSSAYYTIIKSTYDDAIWTYGHWEERTKAPKVIFDVNYPEASLLLVNKVGLIRLQKNTTSAAMQLLMEVVTRTPHGQLVASVAHQRKKPKQIGHLLIDNSYIKPVLIDGLSEQQDLLEIRNTVELDTFYVFLDNPALKKLNGLQLYDLIKLFSLLQELIRKAANLEFDDSINQFTDIHRFPIKIDSVGLLDYFEQRTNYPVAQLETFINLLTGNYGDRLNLWDRPLVRIDGDLFINYMPVLNPILLNLVDYWLEEGGFSLDARGKLLEDYLTTEIAVALREKSFEGQMPTSAKIYNHKKEFEEIDFLLNLKELVVIAEVKCIKYPFDARDQHNALNRLTEAAKQVKRKMTFIQQHEKEVSGQTGPLGGKTFLPIIITNYPIYSTFSIDGIVITDFYLLEGYFAEGVFTDVSMALGQAPQIVKEHIYYSDEKEMNNNLAGFLANPPPVTTLKELFEIRPFRVSMDDVDYEIFVTSAQLKISDTTHIISHLAE